METTLNIDMDIFKQIAEAAQLNHISSSEMIFLFIQKTIMMLANQDELTE
jgi:hypothetical protein